MEFSDGKFFVANLQQKINPSQISNGKFSSLICNRICREIKIRRKLATENKSIVKIVTENKSVSNLRWIRCKFATDLSQICLANNFTKFFIAKTFFLFVVF